MPSWTARILALGHFALALASLSLAMWLGVSCLRVLPHMSTGTIESNLPVALTLGATQAGPFVVLGVWTAVLGRRIWVSDPAARTAVLATHSVLLFLGILCMAYGGLSLHAAGRSAARGGGLMGAVGLFPVAIGAGVSGLALGSIAVVRAGGLDPTSPRSKV
jgi:hypothetical protein